MSNIQFNLCTSFPGLLQTYHESLYDLITTYELYLSYKRRQISLLFNLLFFSSAAELPSITKLESSWMVLQNSIMTKNQQLWGYRRILNETMTTMITSGYISKKQLFEFNHCIVLELQQVEDRFEDLIESETKDNTSNDQNVITTTFGNDNDRCFELSLLDKQPQLFRDILDLHNSLISKYYVVQRQSINNNNISRRCVYI
ncbi:conserved hypothetical protein [Candida dubliniensis CD36]|uniref:Uncharacterized protein n=1 Tax=Candida dubliniensis (strain CD36 / ATCC MYA-646 / CBS 7987 / NCPF 3949 / NRRL Y-17841) TaxID=573826 RepID=B9WG54_CANDC|nr:conserved hypothetical protein [Candida dubliniensis CD36]CAX42224.1 conserved hypothetical protein [Candida dubliniensis CD36]